MLIKAPPLSTNPHSSKTNKKKKKDTPRPLKMRGINKMNTNLLYQTKYNLKNTLRVMEMYGVVFLLLQRLGKMWRSEAVLTLVLKLDTCAMAQWNSRPNSPTFSPHSNSLISCPDWWWILITKGKKEGKGGTKRQSDRKFHTVIFQIMLSLNCDYFLYTFVFLFAILRIWLRAGEVTFSHCILLH